MSTITKSVDVDVDVDVATAYNQWTQWRGGNEPGVWRGEVDRPGSFTVGDNFMGLRFLDSQKSATVLAGLGIAS